MVASGTAGCTVGHQSDEPRSCDRTMSEHEYPTITVTANEGHGSAPSVAGTAVRQCSDKRPALVRLGLQNETGRELVVRSTPPHPFPAFRNRPDDPHRIYLITEDGERVRHGQGDEPIIRDSSDDGCWRIRRTGGHGQVLAGYHLSLDESKESEYVVLADADASKCLPAGDYHFNSTIYINDVGGAFDWTITLTVR